MHTSSAASSADAERSSAVAWVHRDFFDRHTGPELRWVTGGRLKFVVVSEIEDWLRRSGDASGSLRRKPLVVTASYIAVQGDA